MEASAFYRKWRSQKFGDLVGQPAISQTLRNAVKTKRIAHAYLFCGPRGVGKTSAARILAKAINCPNSVDGEPCAVCDTCRSIQDGHQIDVIELDAASNRGIDQVREIREKVGLAPAMLHYKFYILDEAHMLTTEASNALLKTLEEPPPNTVFVLVTTDAQRLPETIVSRCQRLDFRRITVVDAVDRLRFVCEQEGLTPEPGVLEILARGASGSLRDAEGSLDQLVAYAGVTPTIAATRSLLGAAGPDAARSIVEQVVAQQLSQAIRSVNILVDQGADPRQVALDIVESLRSMLLLRTSESLVDLLEVSPETIPALRQVAEQLTPSAIVSLIRVFTPGPATRGGLRSQLPLEMSVVEAGRTLRSPGPGEAAAPAAPAVQRPPVSSSIPRPAAPAPVLVPIDRSAPAPTPVSARPTPVTLAAEPVGPVADKPSAPTRSLDGAILFDEASRRWSDILAACGEKSRSVQALLRDARPVSADPEGLVLGFAYEFHREKIADIKNRTVVEEVIEQVLGSHVRIRCVVSTNRETPAPTDSAQAALDDPLVRAAVAMGARVRAVTDDPPKEKP